MPDTNMRLSAFSIAFILLAGGKATRMGGPIPKPFMQLKNKPVIQYSMDLFEQVPGHCETVVVCEEKYRKDIHHQVTFAFPGNRRQDSVLNGLKALKTKPQFVAVHDSARPLIDSPMLMRLLEATHQSGAAIAAVPVKSTIKYANKIQTIAETLERNLLWEAQTPQVFRLDLLWEAFHHPINDQFDATDDSVLVERIGHSPTLVMGDYRNIKLTTKEDFAIAESLVL